MKPIGPYVQSQGWSSKEFFIVSDWKNGKGVYVVVANGEDRSQGVECPTVRDAKQNLKDNGFVLKQDLSDASTTKQ